MHVAEIHQFDEVSVKVLREEKCVTAGRPLRPADALDALADQIVVPALRVADVEGNVRKADLVPSNRGRGRLRLELEDLQYGSSWHANPTDLARGLSPVHAKELAGGLRGRVGDTDQRAAEHVPVELHRLVEIRHRDAAVAERSSSHVTLPRAR